MDLAISCLSPNTWVGDAQVRNGVLVQKAGERFGARQHGGLRRWRARLALFAVAACSGSVGQHTASGQDAPYGPTADLCSSVATAAPNFSSVRFVGRNRTRVKIRVNLGYLSGCSRIGRRTVSIELRAEAAQRRTRRPPRFDNVIAAVEVDDADQVLRLSRTVKVGDICGSRLSRRRCARFKCVTGRQRRRTQLRVSTSWISNSGELTLAEHRAAGVPLRSSC